MIALFELEKSVYYDAMSTVSKAEKVNDRVTSKFVYSVFGDHSKVLGQIEAVYPACFQP
jgi:hypothetical protein